MKIKKVKKVEDDDLLSRSEMLSMIENNRQRVRAFCNVILSISGLFISTSFVILFFLQDSNLGKQAGNATDIKAISILLIVSDVFLISSLIFAAFTSYSRPPVPIGTKSSAIAYLSNLYRKEQRISLIAFVGMLIGMLLFFTILIAYAITRIG